MMGEDPNHEVSTRREFVKFGGVVGGSLLAGCTSRSSGGSTTTESTETSTQTSTTTEATTSRGDSYTATISPVGDVTFDRVPQNVFTIFPWNADMALALGHGDSINSLWWGKGFGSIMNYFAGVLDGVSVNWTDLPGSYGASKERLYDLDSDVHLVDPAWLSTRDGWDQADIKEVAQNVAPWFGNHYSNLHLTPPDGWADRYQYYTLWELFENVAAVYRERARYQALADVRAQLLSSIEEGLPPEGDRPTVGYIQITTDLSAIYVLRLNAPGYYNAHTRPLGAVDAFGGVEWEGEFKQVDFEALLETDPDVLLTLWGMTSNVDFEKLQQNLGDHPIGQELTAVQNDRVYTQGTRFQGPIMNLFQLEMTAKQLYPDRFGDWPGYTGSESYPDFPEDEQLFDRQHVSDIITGDL